MADCGLRHKKLIGCPSEAEMTCGCIKNTYLIVQVKGYDNHVMSYPVLDQESGKVVNAKIFGIEVPRAVYQKVGSEKKSTGMIKQRIVATKDANTMQFNNKISANDGFITNW